MLRILLPALLVFAGLACAQLSPEEVLQQAVAAHQAGNLDAAIRGYRVYLKVRPEAIDARSNLGAALAGAGRYAEAIAEYREALKRSPRNFRISLNLAIAYYKVGPDHESRDGTGRAAQAAARRTGRSSCCWETACFGRATTRR